MLLCRLCLLVAISLMSTPTFASAREFTLTIDDPHLLSHPSKDPRARLSPQQRDLRILQHLKRSGKKALLFVCGKRVHSPDGKKLLQRWVNNGHFLGNHSWSHLYFHSRRVSLKRFQRDFLRNHQMLKGFSNVLPLFRFPYLKEGNTLLKRDGMRQTLRSRRIQNGYVTVDASDWYVDQKLRQWVKHRKNVPLHRFRSYYLNHMWDRAQYYDGLAKRLGFKQVRHTLLIHHNLLNALFLGDLLRHFQKKGWRLVDANKVYQTPQFPKEPQRLPSGESILWSLAKQRGLKGLRYPAEDGRYEKNALRQWLKAR